MSITNKWDWEIGKNVTTWNWNLKEIWAYRHLLINLVKRDFTLNYQQTILGPLWSLLQPVFTLITYVIVFRNLVGLSVGTLPPILFYFSGIVLWNFFSESFTGTSNTFKEHFYLFSKVYFPRIIMPVSVVCTHFLRCLLQLALLILLVLYYWLFRNINIHFGLNLLGVPLSILLVGSLGLGVGLIISLITVKYRDIANMVSLGIRLLMFMTPVIYPLASVRPSLKWIVEANPLTVYFELFRFSLFGEGTVSYLNLLVSTLITLGILLTALLVFNKKSNSLLDIV
ncbi:ABC transporter permease [Chitinophagaceae bacterium LB-8]|uniref:Transport permease protein n=1 Tax=Paraflavisolibacter caeni TaxID=2982496 RepID=A0A9X3BF52_9BACT|nr:ABC transporter permease [Paraflavisolibacter caeni]MCU7548259.1 ABC transporter permease [Paraflavisolibacter caeni]